LAVHVTGKLWPKAADGRGIIPLTPLKEGNNEQAVF
jgi:hypothetical protein